MASGLTGSGLCSGLVGSCLGLVGSVCFVSGTLGVAFKGGRVAVFVSVGGLGVALGRAGETLRDGELLRVGTGALDERRLGDFSLRAGVGVIAGEAPSECFS